jgi:hypothetical protein
MSQDSGPLTGTATTATAEIVCAARTIAAASSTGCTRCALAIGVQLVRRGVLRAICTLRGVTCTISLRSDDTLVLSVVARGTATAPRGCERDGRTPAYGRCCVPLSRALDRRGPAARGAGRAPDSSTVSQPSLASDDDESSASPVLWETLPRAPLLLKCPLLVIGAGDCSGALGGLASVESPPALRPRPRPLLLLLALAGCDVVEPRPGRILFATAASSSTECVEPTSMRSARRNKSTYKKLEVVGGTTEKARTFECGVLVVVPHGSGAHSEEHDQHDCCDT